MRRWRRVNSSVCSEKTRGEGGVIDVEDALLIDLGLDGAEAAEEPVAVDEGVDEEALVGGSGAEAVVIFGDEFLESGPGFAADELGFRVDAGFEGVHGGAGLAFFGAGSGGFFGVEAIGQELFLSCHKRGG